MHHKQNQCKLEFVLKQKNTMKKQNTTHNQQEIFLKLYFTKR